MPMFDVPHPTLSPPTSSGNAHRMPQLNPGARRTPENIQQGVKELWTFYHYYYCYLIFIIYWICTLSIPWWYIEVLSKSNIFLVQKLNNVLIFKFRSQTRAQKFSTKTKEILDFSLLLFNFYYLLKINSLITLMVCRNIIKK